MHRWEITHASTTEMPDPEVRQHVSLIYPMSVVHTNQNPEEDTVQYFPVVNRRTMQLTYMGLPFHIGSSMDALRVMPEFAPLLTDWRHEGIQPQRRLPGVELQISCLYHSPDFPTVTRNVGIALQFPKKKTTRPYLRLQ